MRMAAIALVVMALAHRCCPRTWGGFLGARPTHHIVLLDDSYSMSDRRGEIDRLSSRPRTLFWRLGQSMLRPASRNRFTLLRLSRCGRIMAAACGPISRKSGSIRSFAERLATKLKSIDVTQTAAEPLAGLRAGNHPAIARARYGRTACDLSLFRLPHPPVGQARRLEEASRATRRTITPKSVSSIAWTTPAMRIWPSRRLEPEEGIRAVGIAWRMKVTVQNFGPARVHKVPSSGRRMARPSPPIASTRSRPAVLPISYSTSAFHTAGRSRSRSTSRPIPWPPTTTDMR